MPIEPRTNDYVDGGRWLDAPGSALESGAYALAMAMATEPGVTGAPDWSAGTLEKRYYDALQDIQSQYLGYDDEGYILNDSDLTDIVLRWERRYKDTYDLYIDNEDDIKPAQLSSDSTQDAKVVLLRCHKGRWQACCYFGEEGRSAGIPRDDSSTDQQSSSQSSTNSMGGQTSGFVSSTALERLDSSDNGVNNTSTAVDSKIEKLANALERLVTGVEKIALAVEARKASEERLYVAIDKLTATLDKTSQQAQTSTRNSLDTIANNHDSTTSTEYEFVLNTPSTVQSAGVTQSPLDPGTADGIVVSDLRPDTTESESGTTIARDPNFAVKKGKGVLLRRLSVEEANKYSRLEGAPQLVWQRGIDGHLQLMNDTHPPDDDELIFL